MKNWLRNIHVRWGSVVLLVGLSLIGISFFKSKPVGDPPVVCQQENSEVELIAVTPEGTKVYRIVAKKIIVPLIVVQSTGGQIQIR